jgi:hypothetical protein
MIPDVPSPYDAIYRDVAELAAAGDVDAARVVLGELVGRIDPDAEPVDHARTLRLGASLARLAGDPVEARHQAIKARRLAEAAGDTGLALAALIELAEDRLANGEHLAAAADFRLAAAELDIAAGDGEPPAHDTLEARSGLLVKEAEALAAAGRFVPAAEVLERAADRAEEAEEGRLAAELLVQAVTIAQQGGRHSHVDRVDARARTAADAVDHPGARAELDVLAAARALDQGDADRALQFAASARAGALAAVQPLTYAGAVLTESGIRDHLGDRVGAYRDLTRGWATVGDLLGAEVAKATFEPPLLELRRRWGAEAFDAAKATYEAARRDELAAEQG